MTIRKTILILSALSFFAVAGTAFAQGFVPLAEIPGLTDRTTANTPGLAPFFNNLYKYLIGLAAALAVIMITWEGLRIATNQDNVSTIMDSKGKIYNAVFGLVLVLSPVLVFSIINPSILNLSLNLPPLGTVTGATLQTGGGGGPVTQQNGCTISGTAGILQIANCPSAAAAAAWSQSCPGNLSTVSQTKLADGTITSAVLICAGTQPYVFIDLDSTLSALVPFALLNLQPLAVTSSNSNNAASAIQFTNTCSSLGWETCFSDRPLLTNAVPCSPLPKTSISSGVSGKCYNQTLSCEEVGVSTKTSELCSKNPGWTPFQ